MSPWNYFPVLPHDIHEPLGLEEGAGKTERDVHGPVSIAQTAISAFSVLDLNKGQNCHKYKILCG